MQITDLLARTGGLQSIAQQLGLDEAQATNAADALMPMILGGLQRQVRASPPEAQGLEGLLDRFGGASLFDEVVSSEPTNPAHGNDLLGQIFGSKDVSRAVAQDASSRSGLDPSLLRRMLPMLAMLAAGYFAKQRTQGASMGDGNGGLGELLGSVLGGLGGGASSGGLGSMLDGGGNRNPLEELLRSLGR